MSWKSRVLPGLADQQTGPNIFLRLRPAGSAPVGRKVYTFLDAYLAVLCYNRNPKPLDLVSITDGKDDEITLIRIAINQHVTKGVKHGHPVHQIGVEFLEVSDMG